MDIRLATRDDAAAILAIYGPYIANTAITFDEEIPTEEEYREKIAHVLENYPFLAAEEGGEIIGYAYASPFRPREAYRFTAETSIYVKPEYKGSGVGRALYRELERLLAKQNVHTAYACITCTDREEDEHLPEGSIPFHEKVGYDYICEMNDCGYKFGKWYSIVWMGKELIPIGDDPEEFIPFSKL